MKSVRRKEIPQDSNSHNNNHAQQEQQNGTQMKKKNDSMIQSVQLPEKNAQKEAVVIAVAPTVYAALPRFALPRP